MTYVVSQGCGSLSCSGSFSWELVGVGSTSAGMAVVVSAGATSGCRGGRQQEGRIKVAGEGRRLHPRTKEVRAGGGQATALAAARLHAVFLPA